MLTLRTDHYFHIGLMHLTGGKPNQDYAISTLDEGVALAVVSDGCSTGDNTDVGARITALTTLEALKWRPSGAEFLDDIAFETVSLDAAEIAEKIRKQIDLSPRDMLATSACISLTSEGGAAHLVGDGVIASKWRDGYITASRYEWAGNMPYYPSYKSQEDNGVIFLKAHKDLSEDPPLKEERVLISPEGEVLLRQEKYLSAEEGMHDIITSYSKHEMQKLLSYVAVFTDGVSSVDGIDWTEAVTRLLAFKSTAGEYAKRRMIRFVKESQKSGRGPLDDIAYAVVQVIPEEEGG